jgi:hypothetical protein
MAERVTRSKDVDRIVRKATVPAGDYYVGDPCYSVPDDLWMAWLEAADYTTPGREHVLVADIDGHPAVGVSTAFGDGVYEDWEGREYPVDAGLIGLVPVRVAKDDGQTTWDHSPDMNYRHRVTFTEPATCYHEDGTIHLGPITIETGD